MQVKFKYFLEFEILTLLIFNFSIIYIQFDKTPPIRKQLKNDNNFYSSELI